MMQTPLHLAIIMDGNGRWAKARGRDRTFGHLRGAQVAKKIITECANLGIPYLTLYAFSTENWFRPLQEISFLMNLLARHLRRERASLIQQNIRFHCLGEIQRLPKEVQTELRRTMDLTASNTGMNLTFALSYGARQELVNGVKHLIKDVQSGKVRAEELEPDLLATYLESSFMPDPDLIIRTSGESRLSNFMLWQAAYSEIFISPTLWPDFTVVDLRKAFENFSLRERRYGRIVTTETSACAPNS